MFPHDTLLSAVTALAPVALGVHQVFEPVVFQVHGDPLFAGHPPHARFHGIGHEYDFVKPQQVVPGAFHGEQNVDVPVVVNVGNGQGAHLRALRRAWGSGDVHVQPIYVEQQVLVRIEEAIHQRVVRIRLRLEHEPGESVLSAVISVTQVRPW